MVEENCLTCEDVCGEESHLDTNRYDCCVCDLPRGIGKALKDKEFFEKKIPALPHLTVNLLQIYIPLDFHCIYIRIFPAFYNSQRFISVYFYFG
jgi:hypothetical protein